MFGVDQDFSGSASIINHFSQNTNCQVVCCPAYVGFFLKHFFLHSTLSSLGLSKAPCTRSTPFIEHGHEANSSGSSKSECCQLWILARGHTLVSAQVLLDVVPVDEKLINQTKPPCIVGFLLLIVGLQLPQPLWPYDYLEAPDEPHAPCSASSQ